jgi:AbrB family looped-hinge helix DNA binding protein
MALNVTMSSKGQVVIPAEYRRRAGFAQGDRIAVTLDEETGEVRLRKPESIDAMAERFTAFLPPGTVPLEDAAAFYRERRARE